MPSEVGSRLKALREESGLTMRQVADHLGWRQSRYQHYEDRYTKAVLPIDLVKGLANILGSRGIDAERIYALAGIAPPSVTKSESATVTSAGVAPAQATRTSGEQQTTSVLRSEFSDGTIIEIHSNRALTPLTIRRLKALLSVHEADYDCP